MGSKWCWFETAAGESRAHSCAVKLCVAKEHCWVVCTIWKTVGGAETNRNIVIIIFKVKLLVLLFNVILFVPLQAAMFGTKNTLLWFYLQLKRPRVVCWHFADVTVLQQHRQLCSSAAPLPRDTEVNKPVCCSCWCPSSTALMRASLATAPRCGTSAALWLTMPTLSHTHKEGHITPRQPPIRTAALWKVL